MDSKRGNPLCNADAYSVIFLEHRFACYTYISRLPARATARVLNHAVGVGANWNYGRELT